VGVRFLEDYHDSRDIIGWIYGKGCKWRDSLQHVWQGTKILFLEQLQTKQKNKSLAIARSGITLCLDVVITL